METTKYDKANRGLDESVNLRDVVKEADDFDVSSDGYKPHCL